MPVERFGAAPEDWAHFDLVLGVGEDLLPVVSNPSATISPNSKMKALGKTPSRYNKSRQVAGIQDWTQHKATARELLTWEKEPDYGICLQTRHIRALDCDIPDNPTLADEIHQKITRFLGRELPCRSRADSSKFLLAFNMPGDYPKRTIETAGGIIEFLGTGQQFIAVGTHPDGARYQWAGGLPTDFPTLDPETFELLWSGLVGLFAVDGTSTTGSPTLRHEKLKEAYQNDPVAVSLHDKGLVRSTGKDGSLHITCPFESEHSMDSADSATTYFAPFTGGFAKGRIVCLHAHCAERPQSDFLEALGLAEDPADDFEAVTPAVVTPGKTPFILVSDRTFAAGKPPGWIIKGILPAGELGVIFGPPGCGKSFFALDMAMAVAIGGPWCGRKVNTTEVAYIAAEGAGGFKKRLQAYREFHRPPDRDLLHIMGAAPNLTSRDHTIILGTALREAKIGLVFYDTLARGMAGSDENAAKDMGIAIAHCRVIHDVTGAMVVLIHHSGKDPSKGARGSNSLLGANDLEIEITRSDHHRTATISKMKDGEDGQQLGFKLHVVPIGMDEDGDVISSCVVEHGTQVIHKSHARLGDREKVVLRAAQDCQKMDGTLPGLNEVLEAAVGELVLEPGMKDRRMEYVKRAFRLLEEKGKLAVVAGGVTVVAER